jgi:hypothetical protein
MDDEVRGTALGALEIGFVEGGLRRGRHNFRTMDYLTGAVGGRPWYKATVGAG